MFTRPGTVARLLMMTASWFCAKCDRPQGGSSNTGGVSCDVSLESEQEHRHGATVPARFEPMKPAPPVTMIFFIYSPHLY